MKKVLRDGSIVFVAVMAGNWAVEKFVLKANPEDSGLILVAPGIGMDDVARAAGVVLVALALNAVVPSF